MAELVEQLNRVELSSLERDRHSRFVLNQKDYSKQYSHLYTLRNQQMRPALLDMIKEKWGDIQIAAKIIDTEANAALVGAGKSQETALVGVLYKEMSLRASVLDEFKESGGISSTGIVDRGKDNFCSANDALVLEDESGRITIGGTLVDRAAEFVTGIVVAVKGTVDADQGIFVVSDLLTYGQRGTNAIGIARPTSEGAVPPKPTATYIMLASGLAIGGGNAKAAMFAQLLVDFLCGRIGGRAEHVLASRIARLVICGNRQDTIPEGWLAFLLLAIGCWLLFTLFFMTRVQSLPQP